MLVCLLREMDLELDLIEVETDDNARFLCKQTEMEHVRSGRASLDISPVQFSILGWSALRCLVIIDPKLANSDMQSRARYTSTRFGIPSPVCAVSTNPEGYPVCRDD